MAEPCAREPLSLHWSGGGYQIAKKTPFVPARVWNTCRGAAVIAAMHLHHWLGWLAICLALLWLGLEMRQPSPEPVAMAAFDDGYLVPTEFHFEGEQYPDQVGIVERCH